MPDALFADPRLAWLYDQFDGERDDLDHYLAITRDLQARTVVDVGCGTGCLALRLAGEGLDVTGVDPARRPPWTSPEPNPAPNASTGSTAQRQPYRYWTPTLR